MSIANRIEQIENHLKDDYQSIANLGADLTNVDKNIENIAELLDGVYDVLPKTEFQEGTEVTIEGGLKGKIDFDEGKVGFGQASQESTQGYQLINNPSFADVTNNNVKVHRNPDGSYTLTGTSTGLAVVKISQALELENGVAYYVSGGISENIGIDIRDNNLNTYGTRSTSPTTTGSFTPTSDMSNMYVCIRVPSGTQTNVTIYPMISKTNTYNWEEYSGGYASPSPNWEQPIQCVTGNQDVVVSGKNKLNFSDVTLESHGVTLQIKDNYFILNGTNDGTESAFIISNYMTPFQTNANTKLKAFQISGTATGSIANPLFRTYANWQNQVNVNFTSSTISDYSEEATYNTSIIAVHGGTFNNYKIGFMVADNLTSGDAYEPYHTPITYPISLGNNKFYNIGTYRDYILRTTGKNLVNPTEIKDASINSTTGDTITYYSSSASKTYVKCAYVKQGVAYTFSKKPNTPSSSAGRIIDIVDDNEVILEAFSVLPSATSYTYTPSHSGWVYMVVDVNATEIQIEEGSTASDYQPYGVGNWYKVGKIGEYTITGNETISVNTDLTNTTRIGMYSALSNNPSVDVSVKLPLSNYFVGVQNWSSDVVGIYTNQNSIVFRVLKAIATTEQEIKTWLSSHSVLVVYVLATPTYTPITGDLATQLEAFWNGQSFNGTTIIESNGDLPMIIKVRALKGES